MTKRSSHVLGEVYKASDVSSNIVYEPEGVLTTTWGGGGNSHYIFLKAMYLGMSVLHDSSLASVALRFCSHNSEPYLYKKGILAPFLNVYFNKYTMRASFIL